MSEATKWSEAEAQVLEMREQAMNPDKLDIELLPYVRERNGLKYLNHPLVQQPFLMPHLNKMSNDMLRHKKEQVQRALESENWGHYVALHERPYRVMALKSLVSSRKIDETDPQGFWNTLSYVWADSENVWQEMDFWVAVFELTGEEEAKIFMDRDEYLFLQQLHFPRKVWRGAREHNKRGLSWTLDRDKAEWFASRFMQQGEVIERTVERRDVFAYMNGRGEQEIILKPSALL